MQEERKVGRPFEYKYEVNESFFDNLITEESSYVLGILFADGNVRKKGNVIRLCLAETDKDILIKIQRLIQPDKPLYYLNVKNGKNQYALDIVSKKIKDILCNIGCTPNKSLTLKYPTEKVIDSHFIRGYIDGDGHISKKQLSIMGTMEILKSISERINVICGKDIPVRFYRKKNVKTNNWQMSIRFKDDRRLVLDALYDGCSMYMDRKFRKYQEFYK